MDIHAPNIVGELSVAGDAGTAGQVLTSAGDGVQVDWVTPVSRVFTFTSASALSHTIGHDLSNSFPSVTVWSTGTNTVVQPASIFSEDDQSLTITFAVPTAIAGTIVG